MDIGLIQKLLEKPIAFQRIFATIAGGATEGLFLSQAYYWSFRTNCEDEWFYKTQEEWHKETALTRREQERARKNLLRLGILEEKKEGTPCKLYYKINRNILYELIYNTSSNPCGCQFVTNSKQECKKVQTSKSQMTNQQVTNDKRTIYTENTYREYNREKNPPPPQPEIVETEVIEETTSISRPIEVAESKIKRYEDLYASGIIPKNSELRDWANLSLGAYIRLYRKSGRVLDSNPNDIDKEFAVAVAKENCRKSEKPTIQLGYNVICKAERNPDQWQKLVSWVVEWQRSRELGQKVNVADMVSKQQRREEIRRAMSTPFEL